MRGGRGAGSFIAGLILAVSVLFAELPENFARAETAEPFQLFTAYSKAGLSPDQYGDKVLIVFHGFRSAAPNGFFKAFQKALKDEYTVLGYTYEYFEPDRFVAEFDAFHRAHLAGKSLIFAGSSLGGFWADFFADRYGAAKVFMSNPVRDPANSPELFLGTHTSEKREITFTVTEDMVRRYEGYSLNPETPVNRFVILSQDDDWADVPASHAIFAANPLTTVLTLSKGGHTINYRKHFIWAAVEAWIRE